MHIAWNFDVCFLTTYLKVFALWAALILDATLLSECCEELYTYISWNVGFIIYLFGYLSSDRSTSIEILRRAESHFYIYTGGMLFLAEVGWTIWASFSCRLLTSFEMEEEMHSRVIQPFEILESGQDALWYWFVISFVQAASTYNTMRIPFGLRCLVVANE